MAVQIVPLVLATLPLVRELVSLVIEAVNATQDEDVSPDRLDAMLETIEAKNGEIQALMARIREGRA